MMAGAGGIDEGAAEGRPLLGKAVFLNETAATDKCLSDDHLAVTEKCPYNHGNDAAAETSHHHNDHDDAAAAISDAQRRLATGLKFALVLNPAASSTADSSLKLVHRRSTIERMSHWCTFLQLGDKHCLICCIVTQRTT